MRKTAGREPLGDAALFPGKELRPLSHFHLLGSEDFGVGWLLDGSVFLVGSVFLDGSVFKGGLTSSVAVGLSGWASPGPS